MCIICASSHVCECGRQAKYVLFFFLLMLNLGSLLFPGYAQTPLSRRLMRQGEHSMAAFILMESSPVMLAPWLSPSARVQANGTSSFEKAHDEDLWSQTAANPDHS